jgi:voltage-gated potassium channel
MAAFGVLMTTTTIGTLGYHYLGAGLWSFWDCFYMTVVTLSTVGYAETLPRLGDVSGARGFTVVLIVLGTGTALYFVSTFTAFIVEGDLVGALKRSRMQKRVDQMSDHLVVCGVGSTGIHILRELSAAQIPFVAIDNDEERLVRLGEDLETTEEILYVVGDATDDHVLEAAGIGRARGIIAALHDDKDNVFVTISARHLNPTARIVAKAIEPSADAKLKRAGADTIVSPNQIGGMRMVSEMVRPRVVEFLDLMLRDRRNLRIEELTIPDESSLVGTSLMNTNIRKATDALVIAVRYPDGSYKYNPGSTAVIEKGTTLIVLGETPEIIRLRKGVSDGSVGAVT